MSDAIIDRLNALEARCKGLEGRVKELEIVVNEHHHYFAAAIDEQISPEEARARPKPNLFDLYEKPKGMRQ